MQEKQTMQYVGKCHGSVQVSVLNKNRSLVCTEKQQIPVLTFDSEHNIFLYFKKYFKRNKQLYQTVWTAAHQLPLQ